MKRPACMLFSGAAVLAGVYAVTFGQAPIGADAGRLDSPAAIVSTEASADATTVVGITLPIQIVTLSAVPEGVITAVPVTEGQAVRKGDVLVSLDDRVARVATQIAAAQAESTLPVDLAKARLEWAERELRHLQTLNSQEAASRKEAEDAAVQAEITRLEHAVARFEHAQAAREHERQCLLLEQFTVKAPFDGYVLELIRRAGESVEQREPIIKLVQLDPLEVRLDCPIGVARRVRPGDRFAVRPLDERWPSREGCVTVVSPMADPASQTVRIKLSVDNHDAGWVAGMKVLVELATKRETSAATEPSRGNPEMLVTAGKLRRGDEAKRSATTRPDRMDATARTVSDTEGGRNTSDVRGN